MLFTFSLTRLSDTIKMGIWLSQLILLPTKWWHERSKGIHSFVVVSWKKCQICATSTFSWPLVWKKLRVELNHIWKGTKWAQGKQDENTSASEASPSRDWGMEGLLLCLSLFPACVTLLVNLVSSLLFFTVDCLYYRLKIRARANYTRCARPGGLATHGGHPILDWKIFIGASCVFRVLRISRGTCVSPALLFLANVGDYVHFIFYRQGWSC